MILGDEITEDDMIAAFISAELGTKRHGPQYHKAINDVEDGKMPRGFLSDKKYATKRRKVLGAVRGWPDKKLFANFPRCAWTEGTIEAKDLKELKYIAYSYWDALSQGTHSVLVGAQSVADNVVVFEQPNTAFWEVEKLVRSGHNFPPLIVVADKGGGYTIVEGHTRATGFALAGTVPNEQKIIIGRPLETTQWSKEQKG